MKKCVLSLLLALSLLAASLPAAAALEGEAQRSAQTLYALGVLQSSSQRLSAPADRATAAVLAVRLAGAGEGGGTAPYPDVPTWAQGAVAYAARQGWVTAAEDGNFAPYRTVTANEWCAMLLGMAGRQGFAPEDAASYARRIGLTARDYDTALTLGDLFESARDALSFPLAGGGTVADRLAERGVCTREALEAQGLAPGRLTLRQVSDRCTAAVVCLSIYYSYGELSEKEPGATGSGFFIREDGLAVTNYHTIDGAIAAYATTVTGDIYPVEQVVWYDAGMDLAVMRVSRTSDENVTTPFFAALELAGMREVRTGDTVYAIGNPLGLGLAASIGIVSATVRYVARYSQPCVMHTADISQGSSGGALMNEYGHVVAVTSGAYAYGNSMYLAVPADPLMELDLTGPGKTLEEVKAERAAAAKANS